MQRDRGAVPRLRVLALAVLLAGGVSNPSPANELTDEDNPFRFAPDCFVYFSNDGDGFYDFTRTLEVGTYDLDLWFTGGAVSEPEPSCAPSAAQTETGDICVLSFVIQKTGAGSLDSFAFESGINGAATVASAGSTLTVNISAANAPLSGGFPPRRIGTLGLTIAEDTEVNLQGGTCIGLGAQARRQAPHTMFVPEPDQYLMLGSLLLGLAALAWLRQRREAKGMARRS